MACPSVTRRNATVSLARWPSVGVIFRMVRPPRMPMLLQLQDFATSLWQLRDHAISLTGGLKGRGLLTVKTKRHPPSSFAAREAGIGPTQTLRPPAGASGYGGAPAAALVGSVLRRRVIACSRHWTGSRTNDARCTGRRGRNAKWTRGPSALATGMGQNLPSSRDAGNRCSVF
jgi:hypothetical protein